MGEHRSVPDSGPGLLQAASKTECTPNKLIFLSAPPRPPLVQLLLESCSLTYAVLGGLLPLGAPYCIVALSHSWHPHRWLSLLSQNSCSSPSPRSAGGKGQARRQPARPHPHTCQCPKAQHGGQKQNHKGDSGQKTLL